MFACPGFQTLSTLNLVAFSDFNCFIFPNTLFKKRVLVECWMLNPPWTGWVWTTGKGWGGPRLIRAHLLFSVFSKVLLKFRKKRFHRQNFYQHKRVKVSRLSGSFCLKFNPLLILSKTQVIVADNMICFIHRLFQLFQVKVGLGELLECLVCDLKQEDLGE